MSVVRSIPVGSVVSYARVALMAGKPGSARQVARALKAASVCKAPWWRVIRSDGTVATEMFAQQSSKLQTEGATFRGRRVVFANQPTSSR